MFDHTRLELSSTGLVDTSGCHDITVLAPRQLAAAACLSVGQIWDISNIRRPEPLMTLDTSFVRAWHSAQFTWDGSASPSAMRPAAGVLGRCRVQDNPQTGAAWIYEVSSGRELSLYKLPRVFGEDDQCTMHNFTFVPGVDRDT